MKKLILILAVFVFGLTTLSAKSSDKKAAYQIPDALAKDIKNWPAEKLEALSAVYLELGKQFYELKKNKNSKACFMYSIQVLPTSKSAEEAKTLLKKYWEIIIP